MKKIFYTDIKDKKEFNRAGYHYTCVKADDENHIYLYEMHHLDKDLEMPYMEYELVKARKYTQPNGTTAYIYPSDRDWGVCGWTIIGPEERCRQQIESKWAELLHIG